MLKADERSRVLEKQMILPVILAGGAGTRLWPLSRHNYPKQFMPLIGERSLFQEALLRVADMEEVSAPIIICNQAHRFLVLEQLRELEIEPEAVIVESVVRSTAPALTIAALYVEKLLKHGQDLTLLVMPADHLVADVQGFADSIRIAAGLATESHIVTFGITPTSPETGYGYIEVGSKGLTQTTEDATCYHRVMSFVEKPDVSTAQSYLVSGNYLWNSGIFMMKPGIWMSELARFRPDILEFCRSAFLAGQSDGSFFRPGPEFIDCPVESIDYAVMEYGPGGIQSDLSGDDISCKGYSAVDLSVGWSDIGAWSAVWDNANRDEEGNVIDGDVYSESTKNSLLLARSRLLATVGIKDLVVIETPDAVLVAHKESVQKVKNIVDRIKTDGRAEQENHRKVHRPWGSYETVDQGDMFQVKRLVVNPRSSLSLQKHTHRAEHWIVVSGIASVTIGDKKFNLSQNQSTFVPQGSMHRLENEKDDLLEIIEVQTGDYLGEDDIVRFQDKYGRHEIN